MEQTIKEVRYLVGEAWKGAYDPEEEYNVAAVVQDPAGLSVYRSRKSGNVGHPLSDQAWWICIIDLSEIKTESDRIAALNTAIANDEDLRTTAEYLRLLNEEGRVDAERLRVAAESDRTTAETQRRSNEETRNTNEGNRQKAEIRRGEAETTRNDKENQRQQAETLRNRAESDRATAEASRVSAEKERNRQFTSDHERATLDHDKTAAANAHPPRVSETTLCWEIWDAEAEAYVDSGVMATASPYATFGINTETGNLEEETSPTYAGPGFSLDTEHGNLEITI